jgi:hypothetical protein
MSSPMVAMPPMMRMAVLPEIKLKRAVAPFRFSDGTMCQKMSYDRKNLTRQTRRIRIEA